MKKKPPEKYDETCNYFIHGHCLKTQSVHGCQIVMKCDTDAKYCVKMKGGIE